METNSCAGLMRCDFQARETALDEITTKEYKNDVAREEYGTGHLQSRRTEKIPVQNNEERENGDELLRRFDAMRFPSTRDRA
jgi:hypothetical protein